MKEQHIQAMLMSVALAFSGCRQAFAQENVGEPTVSKAVNLDLSSTRASVLAPTAASIRVGNNTLSVAPGQLLTPAQNIAVSQVLSGGVSAQTIQVNMSGAASGGSMIIGQNLAQNLTGLTVPQGVTVVNQSANLNLIGNLNNAGSIYAVSMNPLVHTANISALNIINQSGALLTSVLPAGGLPGVASAISNLNLNLSAVNDIINSGTISSSANLSMTAGASIANVHIDSVSAPPVIQAAQDLNLSATNIVNSGTLASLNGNITAQFASTISTSSINNTNGVLQALNGNINVLADLQSYSQGISLTGGDWLSRQLNVEIGKGSLAVNVSDLTGQVNVSAGEAHLVASTPDLNLGNINIVGDPTWFNTNGNVLISGPILASGNSPDIAIVASGHIVSITGASTIDSSSAQTGDHAGEITLVAGALFSEPPTAVSGEADESTQITFTSPSASDSGGGIYLDGTSPAGFSGGTPAALGSISSAGGGFNKSGADASFIAYRGAASGSGVVKLPSSLTVFTGGTGKAHNGDVLIIAGASSGNSISAGNFQTSGGMGDPGNVSIFAAQPVISNSGTITIESGKVISPSGEFIPGTFTNASISIGNVLTAGDGGIGAGPGAAGQNGSHAGAITIRSGGDIQTKDLIAFGGGGGGGDTAGGHGGDGGKIEVVSLNGAIWIVGTANSSGGGGGGSNAKTGSHGGAAGVLTLNAAGALRIDGPVIAAAGGGGPHLPNGPGSGAAEGGGGFGGGGGAGSSFGFGGAGGGGGFYGGGGAGGGGALSGSVGGSGGGYNHGGAGGAGGAGAAGVGSGGGGGGGGGWNTGGGGGARDIALGGAGADGGGGGGKGGAGAKNGAGGQGGLGGGKGTGQGARGFSSSGKEVDNGRSGGYIGVSGGGQGFTGWNDTYIGVPLTLSGTSVQVTRSVHDYHDPGDYSNFNAVISTGATGGKSTLIINSSQNPFTVIGDQSLAIAPNSSHGNVYGWDGIYINGKFIDRTTNEGTFAKSGSLIAAPSLSYGTVPDPPPFQTVKLSSLDLTDPLVVQFLLTSQTNIPDLIGGSLVVSGGIAVGGNLILNPNVDLSALESANIPSGVTLTLMNFTDASSININLSSNSHTPTVVINGTQQFLSSTVGGSTGVINITSSMSSVPSFTLGGQLASDGSLTINSAGIQAPVSLNGTLSASGPITLNTDGNITQSVNSSIVTPHLKVTLPSASLHGQNQISAFSFGSAGAKTDSQLALNNTVPLVLPGNSDYTGNLQITNTAEVVVNETVDTLNPSAGPVGVIVNSAVFTNPSITINGSVVATAPVSSSSDTIQLVGNGAGSALSVVLGNTGVLSTSIGGISFNGNSSGPVSITTLGSNKITAAGSGIGGVSLNATIPTAVVSGIPSSILSAGSLTLSKAPSAIMVNSISSISMGGAVSFTAPAAISSPGVITLSPGANVASASALTINSKALVNPNGITAKGPVTLNINNNAGSGTIANPNGDVVLTNNMVINSGGRNLAIIAAGNVVSSGASVINLSTAKDAAGQLTVLAGVKFSSNSSMQGSTFTDNSATFTINGTTASGGNINLAKTAINTMSSASATTALAGGSVTMVANAGTEAAGTILIGAINSSSKHGVGGAVQLIGPGGIIVGGAINTSGPTGGGKVALSATPVDVTGVQITAGKVSSGSIQAAAVANPSLGSAIRVDGAINSSSSFAGAIRALGQDSPSGKIAIDADSHVSIKGAINSSGYVGGDVSLFTANGGVSVAGKINTGGVTPKGSNDFGYPNGGSGGGLAISAPAFVSILGNVITAGSNASKTNFSPSSNGGNGGTVNIGSPNSVTGNVLISGYVNVSGGDSLFPASKAQSGSSGTVSIEAAAIQISGSTASAFGPASIIATAGNVLAGGTTGSNGSVNLTTHALQGIPANFNLSSKSVSEYAVPGQLFTVGGPGAVINGTKAGIVTGSGITTANSKAANGVVAGGISNNVFQSSDSLLSISATGNGHLVELGSGSFKYVYSGTAGQRMKLTPAEALAMYQLTHGQSQTVGLNLSGQFVSNTQSSPSEVTIQQADLPQKFQHFNLPSGLQLNIEGPSPVLDLSSTAMKKIGGVINFVSNSSLAVVDFGTVPLSLPVGAGISSSDQLAIVTSSITNNGSISAEQLHILPSAGKFKLTNTGSLNATALLIPNMVAPANVVINNQGGVLNAPAASFVPLQLPTSIGKTVSTLTESFTTISFSSGDGAELSLDEESGTLSLYSGEIFINPTAKATLHTELGDVKIKKGAIVSASRDDSGVRIINCSAQGDVVILVSGREIALAAGEELILSDHPLSTDEKQKADGIGRRGFKHFVIGNGVFGSICDVSLVSMISNLPHLEKIKHPVSAIEKQVASRLLKTAVVLQTVTSHRGRYLSNK